MKEFENIIIGAGPAGYELAHLLSQMGEEVCVIERDTPGGTCLNRGCIPTKCLAATAEAAADAREAAALGVNVEYRGIDYSVAHSRMLEVVAQLVEGVKHKLKDCTCISGEAVIIDNRTVKVGDDCLTARKRLVIATGSRPAIPPIEGVEHCITSDELLAMQQLPESIAIVGGGVIGMEFASILHDLGVKVTVIEFCKEILPPFDPETAKRLRTTLSRRGIDIIVGAAVKEVSPYGNSLCVAYEGKKGMNTVEASVVLMAVGRKAVLPAGIENTTAGISPRGFIEVDPKTLMTADGLYAIGDVNGLSMLAHSAYAQAKAVAFHDPSLFVGKAVPSVVFSRPEVSQVGATPASLQADGISFLSLKKMYAANGKALASGHPEGFLKMLIDENTGTVLGTSIIGSHAADLIAEATMIVDGKFRATDTGIDSIHAHPTLSELFIQ